MDERIIEVEIYDARGNGEGGVSPTLTGDHENRITDYTAIIVLNGQGGGRGYVIYESISNENRSLMCEQPSGELHRTGCVQRYASGVQEE